MTDEKSIYNQMAEIVDQCDGYTFGTKDPDKAWEKVDILKLELCTLISRCKIGYLSDINKNVPALKVWDSLVMLKDNFSYRLENGEYMDEYEYQQRTHYNDLISCIADELGFYAELGVILKIDI